MERVDHIYIIQVSSCCFVCQIDRMFQRNVPDWECFKFGITGSYSAVVFVIQLGKTGCHFSASRSWCSDNYQRSCGLDIFVLSISFITYDKRDIAWISGNTVVEIYFDAEFFKTFLEMISTFLTGITCNAYTAYIETTFCKGIDQTQNIFIVSNTKVSSHFVFVNICSTDNDNDLCLIAQLHEHT